MLDGARADNDVTRDNKIGTPSVVVVSVVLCINTNKELLRECADSRAMNIVYYLYFTRESYELQYVCMYVCMYVCIY